MSPRQPESFVYYLDANLDGPELVSRLREGGMRCEPHRAHFSCDEPDDVWIPEIASRRWVIVTRDFAVQRRPNERAAWTSAKATVVMIRGHKLSAADIAKALLAAHAQGRLDNYILRRLPPMILYLSPDGELRTHLGGERRGAKKK